MVFFRIHANKLSNKLSINKQNFAVSVASGGPYDVNILLTAELNTWAANFTFMIEYGVNFICSYDSFGNICNPHSWSS